MMFDLTILSSPFQQGLDSADATQGERHQNNVQTQTVFAFEVLCFSMQNLAN